MSCASPVWTTAVPLPGPPFWVQSAGLQVNSGFINGEDRQISPSSPVLALAKLLCCHEGFSGADFKVTGKCASAEWRVCIWYSFYSN